MDELLGSIERVIKMPLSDDIVARIRGMPTES